jgi:hypothetical protein
MFVEYVSSISCDVVFALVGSACFSCILAGPGRADTTPQEMEAV